MSSPQPLDLVTSSGQSWKSKKKSKKKRSASTKPETNGEPPVRNYDIDPPGADGEEQDVNGEDEEATSGEIQVITTEKGNEKPANHVVETAKTDDDWKSRYVQNTDQSSVAQTAHNNGLQKMTGNPSSSLDTGNHNNLVSIEDPSTAADGRLEALAREREALKAEVTELRKSLESIQVKHEQEITELQEELEESQAGKELADTQYRDLLGRVNTIKSQLGERLKSDAAELEQRQTRIDELEDQSQSLRDANDSLKTELSKITKERDQQAHEINELRSRASLSQQNWIKERDELISREAYARDEFETAKQAMHDWEMLAMEERALRQNLSDRVAELEEQLSTQQEAFDKSVSERDTLTQTVDGLQRALRDIQEARKKELRELVENSQAQLDDLRKLQQNSEEAAAVAQNELEVTKKELERALPFEREVKEKTLLIGKLRHEAVILNDHLTKALRFLKQRKPEDMVDRQLVTNHFLHFITLDRTDPKKFQVLQLIAALLAWNDEQKEQAGLARPGASASILRVPMTPFRRTPSSPSLSTAAESPLDRRPSSASKESLAELWSDFLEREAREGGNEVSRKRSTSIKDIGPLGLETARQDSSI